MKAFEVNVKGREWATVIRAETAGKAKYEYLLDVWDSWPDVGFKDLTCYTLKTIPPTNQEIAEREAAAFNERHPLGTLVNYWSMLKEGEPTGTGRIKHVSTVMCDHAVAWIEGARSCHAITHVEKAMEEEA
jgi:hypothetical protein